MLGRATSPRRPGKVQASDVSFSQMQHLNELAFDYGAMQSDDLLPEDALSFAKLMERCHEIDAKANAAIKPAE